MVELLLPCKHAGCTCAAGRVVSDGEIESIELYSKRHHGKPHQSKYTFAEIAERLRKVKDSQAQK
jgi:hypothetical protein